MRIGLWRLGAIGDMLGITPLLRYLKQQQNEVYVLTKKTGEDILKYNPNVDKLILYNDELKKSFPDLDDVPNDKLGEFFKAIEQAYECDKSINLCESWEVKLARYPHEPNFKYPTNIAREICDRNYYEQLFLLSGLHETDLNGILMTPEMFFDSDEEIQMSNWFVDFRKLGKFVILWGLSGSAANKTYPYCPEVIYPILEKYPQVVFLTVGDDVCRILEIELKHDRIINRSGTWSIRQSCLATKYANLVIAPDTGILHASGCYDTPKIGLLNHTTRNNITKYFKNDYSLHASQGKHPFFGAVSCSPCYKIHQAKKITCNLMPCKDTQIPVCMGTLEPGRIIKRIEEVING